MNTKNIGIIATIFLLTGCGEQVSRGENPRILAMGDSMLAWHRASNRSVSDSVERDLSEVVVDRSTIGARFIYSLPISGSMGLNISRQLAKGDWDWVILNGGGNDLWFGCGCIACDYTINRIISSDGSSGILPELISEIRKRGARVIYVGYLHSPDIFSIVDHCKNEGIELENRIANYASNVDGFFFVSVSKMVPSGDKTFHAPDMIHPSKKASRIIGQLVSGVIRSHPR